MKISPVYNNQFFTNKLSTPAKRSINFHSKDNSGQDVLCEYNLCQDKISVCRENFPEDYITKTYANEYVLKPHYSLLHLESFKNGEGKKAIKKIVRESVENPHSQGRVTLFSSNLNNGPYSAGFYYKLGFRFNYPPNNVILENWLHNGGKKDSSPKVEGPMYLPKENISRCLNY